MAHQFGSTLFCCYVMQNLDQVLDPEASKPSVNLAVRLIK